MPRTLVCIVVRNAASWIADAVRRLRDAGYAVLVLDNGSADATAVLAQQSGAEVLKFAHEWPLALVWRQAFRYTKNAHPDAERFIAVDGRRQPHLDTLLRAIEESRERWLVVRAPFWTLPSLIVEFSCAYLRPRHIWAFLPKSIPVIVAVGFAVSVYVQINRSIENVRPPVFRTGESSMVSAERIQALRWLARHSPEDAVVMADQFDGNYIVALAGRRVVSSSKVYPSEAAEVSKRYTDIAKFFFATDEESAMEIARAYDVDYVFIATDFSYSKNCKLANACQFVASGELTPIGRKMTMIGRLWNREPLKYFELVWDSPNFSIFRIQNNRTLRNPCRLTQEEKAMALKIARGAPGALLRECALSMSAYQDGRRFGPVVLTSKSLGQAIREAARAVLADAGPGARLQIAVWSEEELVRRDIKNFLERSFDVTKVLVMERQGKRAVFLPEEFNLRIFRSNTEVLDMLCSRLGMAADCWRTETKIFVAPVTIFAEDGQGGVVPVSGTIPLTGALQEFSDRVFRERLIAARDWIWRMRTESGDFRNEIDPHSPSTTPEETRLASLHGAAETWWLLEFYRAVADLPDVVRFGHTQSDRFEQLINSGNEERTAFLIYAGLENLSLWRITKEAKYLERASRYADILRQLFIDEANLAHSFRLRNGMPEIVNSSSAGTIANNSGLYFLAEVLVEKPDTELRDAMVKFARAIQYNFRKNRILDPDISIVWESWLVNAFASVAKVTENRADAEFALEVANWILDYQSQDVYPHLRGAFMGRAATSGVGKITEALIEAAMLAERLGEDPEPYLAGFREAMRWLMSVQYTDASYFLSEKNRGAMYGALRSGLTDITAEIDNAGHMVIAGAWYLSWKPPMTNDQ